MSYSAFAVAQEANIRQQEQEVEFMDTWLEAQHEKGEMLDVLTSKEKEKAEAEKESARVTKEARIGMQQSAKSMVSASPLR